MILQPRLASNSVQSPSQPSKYWCYSHMPPSLVLSVILTANLGYAKIVAKTGLLKPRFCRNVHLTAPGPPGNVFMF